MGDDRLLLLRFLIGVASFQRISNHAEVQDVPISQLTRSGYDESEHVRNPRSSAAADGIPVLDNIQDAPDFPIVEHYYPEIEYMHRDFPSHQDHQGVQLHLLPKLDEPLDSPQLYKLPVVQEPSDTTEVQKSHGIPIGQNPQGNIESHQNPPNPAAQEPELPEQQKYDRIPTEQETPYNAEVGLSPPHSLQELEHKHSLNPLELDRSENPVIEYSRSNQEHSVNPEAQQVNPLGTVSEEGQSPGRTELSPSYGQDYNEEAYPDYKQYTPEVQSGSVDAGGRGYSSWNANQFNPWNAGNKAHPFVNRPKTLKVKVPKMLFGKERKYLPEKPRKAPPQLRPIASNQRQWLQRERQKLPPIPNRFITIKSGFIKLPTRSNQNQRLQQYKQKIPIPTAPNRNKKIKNWTNKQPIERPGTKQVQELQHHLNKLPHVPKNQASQVLHRLLALRPNRTNSATVKPSEIDNYRTNKSSSPQPITTPSPVQPEVTTPSPAKPDVTTPSPAQHEVTTPSPAQPEVTTPSPAQPEVTTPSPVQPEVTTPSPVQPEVTTPSPAKPEVNTSSTTEPDQILDECVHATPIDTKTWRFKGVKYASFQLRVVKELKQIAKKHDCKMMWYDIDGTHVQDHVEELGKQFLQYKITALSGPTSYGRPTQCERKKSLIEGAFTMCNPDTQVAKEFKPPVQLIEHKSEISWTLEKGLKLKEGSRVSFDANVPSSVMSPDSSVKTINAPSEKLNATAKTSFAVKDSYNIEQLFMIDPMTALTLRYVSTREEVELPFTTELILEGYVLAMFDKEFDGKKLHVFPVTKFANDIFHEKDNSVVFNATGVFKGARGITTEIYYTEWAYLNSSDCKYVI